MPEGNTSQREVVQEKEKKSLATCHDYCDVVRLEARGKDERKPTSGGMGSEVSVRARKLRKKKRGTGRGERAAAPPDPDYRRGKETKRWGEGLLGVDLRRREEGKSPKRAYQSRRANRANHKRNRKGGAD